MFFHESDIIANRYPDLSGDIKGIDAYLHDIGGILFRLERAADHLELEPSLLKRILDLYCEEEAIETVEVFLCPTCDQILEESHEEGFFCDLCEEYYREAACSQETVFRARPKTVTGTSNSSSRLTMKLPEASEEFPDRFLDDPFQLTPLLSYYSRKVTGQPFSGKRLLCLLHFLRDLVPFVEAMKQLGLDPRISHFYYKEYPYPQRDEIRSWLKVQGCQVHCVTDLDQDLRALELEKSARVGDVLVIEDGGHIYARLLGGYSRLLQRTLGCVEQTTRGIRNIENALSKLEQPCSFSVPVLSVARSELKTKFEPPHVADAVFRNIRRVLGDMDLRGKKVALLGYGAIGEMMSERLKSEHMRVTVYDPNDARRLVASQSGCEVCASPREAVQEKFLVIGSSGECAVGRDEILALKHMTHLVSASSEQYEFAIHELDALSGGRTRPYSPQGEIVGTVFTLRKEEKEVILLANGYPINFWGFESMPNQASDLVLSLLLLASVTLASGLAEQSGIDVETVNKLATEYSVASLYLAHHAT